MGWTGAFVTATPLARPMTVLPRATCPRMSDTPVGNEHADPVAIGGEGDDGKPKGIRKRSVTKVSKRTIRSNASWANVFFDGFGRKGPGSDPGWDLRPKSQRPIEDGRGVCDNCKGTGVMTCTFCNGNDFFNVDGSLVVCPACGGEKEVTCTVCFGTKKQVELVGNWWERGVEGLFDD